MKDELDKFTDSFNKVHSMRAADTYVEPTVWTEAIAPVYKPFPRVKVGPSGAGMPLVHLLFLQKFLRGQSLLYYSSLEVRCFQ